jgi:hypothetical protein
LTVYHRHRALLVSAAPVAAGPSWAVAVPKGPRHDPCGSTSGAVGDRALDLATGRPVTCGGSVPAATLAIAAGMPDRTMTATSVYAMPVSHDGLAPVSSNAIAWQMTNATAARPSHLTCCRSSGPPAP